MLRKCPFYLLIAVKNHTTKTNITNTITIGCCSRYVKLLIVCGMYHIIWWKYPIGLCIQVNAVVIELNHVIIIF